MTLKQFLNIVRARWVLALGVLLLALAAAGAASWLMPRKYSATASLVLDIKSPDPIAGTVYPVMAMPSYMATQVDIIESDRVALRVIRSLSLADNAAMKSQWQRDTQGAGRFEVWLANLLQQNLDVKPSRESSLIHITFKSIDPRFSAAVANAFAQAYIDTTAELRVDPARQYASFFEARAKKMRDDIEKAQARLSDFQRSNGILANEERLDIETTRLNELSSQLVALQAVAAESQSRESAAKTAADRLGDVINHPVVAGLRSDLSRQEARLQELSTRFGDAYPQVAELKANIAELQRKLEQETTRLSGSVVVTSGINQSREAQVRASLEQQRAKVLKMKEVRDEAAVLQREVEHAQRAYDGVMARLNLTNLESQNTLTNATVLMPATEPAKPSSPQLVFNMAVALGAGACAALALALLREVTDRRVRTLEDISRGMGLPVLGVLLGRARRNWLGRMRPHPIPPRLLGRSRSYRRAALSDGDLDPVSALLAARTAAPDRARASGNGDGGTRNTAETIGQLIRNHRTLSDEQIDQILEHQRAHGIRFGESAVALGLANEADVVRALARQFQYPVTEALPAAGIQPELVVAHRPFSPQAEAFRGIRAQLMMRLQVGRKDQRRAIAVISHDSGDGRSYAAANLAVAFSQLGGRTLLIDADLRAPRQHRVFALEGVDGLSNVLSGRVSSYTLPSVPALPSLFVLPVGVVPPNPQELLEQPAFDRLLADVLQKFDHVVVDTPAFRHGMDSMVVAGKCGAAVIIARRHRSHSAAMQDLVACLSETPAELAGVLVNEH